MEGRKERECVEERVGEREGRKDGREGGQKGEVRILLSFTNLAERRREVEGEVSRRGRGAGRNVFVLKGVCVNV